MLQAVDPTGAGLLADDLEEPHPARAKLTKQIAQILNLEFIGYPSAPLFRPC
jgi:hypothetical protein